MRRIPILVAFVSTVSACAAFAAGPPDPSQSTVIVVNPGGPPLTYWNDVCPRGDGGMFVAQLQFLRVILRDAQGAWCSGIPAADIEIRSPNLLQCRPWIADAPSSSTGETMWTQSYRGGGCSTTVDVIASGVHVGSAFFQIHSWDVAGGPLGPDGSVDAADLAALASRFGNPGRFDFCFDWNESGGPTIDASDLSSFALHLGHRCP